MFLVKKDCKIKYGFQAQFRRLILVGFSLTIPVNAVTVILKGLQ